MPPHDRSAIIVGFLHEPLARFKELFVPMAHEIVNVSPYIGADKIYPKLAFANLFPHKHSKCRQTKQRQELNQR